MHTPIFLADNVTVAPNGKVNFEGANLTDVIYIDLSNPPYTLVAIVVLSLPLPPKVGSLRWTLRDAAGTILSERPSAPFTLPPSTPNAYMPIGFPVELRLEGPGTLHVEFEGSFGKLDRTWRIEVGAAPSGRADARSQHILDVQAAGTSTLAERVLGAANRSLDVADQYLERGPAVQLLKAAAVSSKVKIRLLVSRKTGWTYRNHLYTIRRSYPHLDVRSAKRIHDRIVIANSSEVHLFGGSLKDLNRPRVTFAMRVTDQSIWKAIIDLFEAEWSAATPV